MSSTGAEEAFASFVAQRSSALQRSAWLLTGSEQHAQDLVQSALVAVWARWSTIDNQMSPENYVRRVMLTTFLTWRRRRWWSERASADLPEDASRADESGDAATRLSVRVALARLSHGQRAAVVLRYFDDLSEADAAAAMGCSVGTVKSQAARALTRLRADPSLAELWGKATQ